MDDGSDDDMAVKAAEALGNLDAAVLSVGGGGKVVSGCLSYVRIVKAPAGVMSICTGLVLRAMLTAFARFVEFFPQRERVRESLVCQASTQSLNMQLVGTTCRGPSKRFPPHETSL